MKTERLPRELIEYQHGYCYTYAIALAHVFDKGITLIWDVNATTEELEPIGQDCLIHAFVTPDNCTAVDAGGHHDCIRDLINSYPCNEEAQEVVSVLRLYRIAKEKGWYIPSDDEVDSLITHVKSRFSHILKRR